MVKLETIWIERFPFVNLKAMNKMKELLLIDHSEEIKHNFCLAASGKCNMEPLLR